MIPIILANQKGGVGKTTLTRDLGLYLGSIGKCVLLVDCDPQGNLTKSLPTDPAGPGVYEAIEGQEVCSVAVGNGVSLLTGDSRLTALEKRLVGELDGYQRLKEVLGRQQYSHYDLVLFDTPPSLGMLTVNAMVASRWVVIPMTASQYSMQGTDDLLTTIRRVRGTLNPDLGLLGAVINAVDRIPVITRQIREEIRQGFGSVCFETEILKTIRVEEAIATRQGVIAQTGKEWDRLKEQIAALATELLERLERGGVPV